MENFNLTKQVETDVFSILAKQTRNELPFYLTIDELIELLPYGKTKIYEFLNSGQIPSKKIEGKWIIPRDKFLAWFYGDLDTNKY
jgi:excisionase family DNA binding protein